MFENVCQGLAAVRAKGLAAVRTNVLHIALWMVGTDINLRANVLHNTCTLHARAAAGCSSAIHTN